ncbi:hypothetical protein O7635_33050 [Asanoa sp. WMMD1127]|uniref:hypothetical protein n=1 Tax=Asanoa sp. WMMD1127 TaxID=3016107 RepID=UPI002417373B|nr:hypothetical protein [Asanoa sp. WMMD1127]MDG4826703.1 hypothetical protein [Asanoa sp. WMMD1127]
MSRFGVRPSRPQAALMAVFGTVILVAGVVQFVRTGQFDWFTVLFVLAGLWIVGFSVLAALGKGPALFTSRERGAPTGGLSFRPSRPVAVAGAVFGAAVIIFGVVQFARAGAFSWFLVVWAVLGASVVGFNLWSAFARNGASQRMTEEN